jgi:hypothetical protein
MTFIVGLNRYYYITVVVVMLVVVQHSNYRAPMMIVLPVVPLADLGL